MDETTTQPQIPSAPEPAPEAQFVSSAPVMNYAGFFRRFAAIFIDGLIIGFLVGLIMVPLTMVSAASGDDSGGMISLIGYPIMFLISWGYPIYFIGSSGATLGKKAVGIKVVKADGSHPTYVEAFLREIVGKFVSGLVFDLGYFWMLWDSQKQTWHDKIAKTYVVKV